MWPEVFNGKAVDAWVNPAAVTPIPKPDFADNEELKKKFGIALAQGLNSFDAGISLFPDQNTAKGLWVSTHWVSDPIVIAAKDIYLKSLKKMEKPLDKEELLAEVLAAARLAEEDKDKAALFKLYSDIAGYTGKQLIDASTNFNSTDNSVKIVLVGGSDKSKTIDAPNSNHQSKMQNEETALPKLRLVGGASR